MAHACAGHVCLEHMSHIEAPQFLRGTSTRRMLQQIQAHSATAGTDDGRDATGLNVLPAVVASLEELEPGEARATRLLHPAGYLLQIRKKNRCARPGTNVLLPYRW